MEGGGGKILFFLVYKVHRYLREDGEEYSYYCSYVYSSSFVNGCVKKLSVIIRTVYVVLLLFSNNLGTQGVELTQDVVSIIRRSQICCQQQSGTLWLQRSDQK